MDVVAMAVGAMVALALIAFGHYFWRPPRHTLVRHEIATYGTLCVLAGLDVFGLLLVVDGQPCLWWYWFFLQPACFAVCGFLSWALFKYDGHDTAAAELAALRSQNADLRAAVDELRTQRRASA